MSSVSIVLDTTELPSEATWLVKTLSSELAPSPPIFQVHHAVYLVGRVWEVKGLSNKLWTLFKGPGWSQGKPRLGCIEDIPLVHIIICTHTHNHIIVLYMSSSMVHVKVVYGLVHPLGTWDPFWAQVHNYMCNFKVHFSIVLDTAELPSEAT